MSGKSEASIWLVPDKWQVNAKYCKESCGEMAVRKRRERTAAKFG